MEQVVFLQRPQALSGLHAEFRMPFEDLGHVVLVCPLRRAARGKSLEESADLEEIDGIESLVQAPNACDKPGYGLASQTGDDGAPLGKGFDKPVVFQFG
jgi:hypothetical protein